MVTQIIKVTRLGTRHVAFGCWVSCRLRRSALLELGAGWAARAMLGARRAGAAVAQVATAGSSSVGRGGPSSTQGGAGQPRAIAVRSPFTKATPFASSPCLGGVWHEAGAAAGGADVLAGDRPHEAGVRGSVCHAGNRNGCAPSARLDPGAISKPSPPAGSPPFPAKCEVCWATQSPLLGLLDELSVTKRCRAPWRPAFRLQFLLFCSEEVASPLCCALPFLRPRAAVQSPGVTG